MQIFAYLIGRIGNNPSPPENKQLIFLTQDGKLLRYPLHHNLVLADVGDLALKYSALVDGNFWNERQCGDQLLGGTSRRVQRAQSVHLVVTHLPSGRQETTLLRHWGSES